MSRLIPSGIVCRPAKDAQPLPPAADSSGARPLRRVSSTIATATTASSAGGSTRARHSGIK